MNHRPLAITMGFLSLALLAGHVASAGDVRRAGMDARPLAAPVVNHHNLAEFRDLNPAQIAAAAALNVLFIDHSVGLNISDGLDCTAFASQQAAPARCKRFEHVTPELSADAAWFPFGTKYDRSRWIYQAGGGSYWREWPAYVETLLAGKDWDVIIPMPSYLVGPNGGWQPIEDLERAHPDITFVYATTSLPRGAPGDTARDQVMERFNTDARNYALSHSKPFLDVADLLSHDYAGKPCYDTRDGVEYCQSPGRCDNPPDDGVAIPAICQHYTSELSGGHLGSVSGGALRMAQAMWLLMARLAEGQGNIRTSPPPTATATLTPVRPTSTPVEPSATPPPPASATPKPEASATVRGPSPTASATSEPIRSWLSLPWVDNR